MQRWLKRRETRRETAFEANMNAPIAEQYQAFAFHPDMVDQARLDAHFQQQLRLCDGLKQMPLLPSATMIGSL